jgi:hypothetical protein
MTRYGIDTRSVTREQLAAALAAEFTFLKPESGSFQKSAAAIFAALPQPAPAATEPRTPNGERLYRAWWHIHWSKGNSLHPQWEQLDPATQRTWLTLGEAEYARLRGGA